MGWGIVLHGLARFGEIGNRLPILFDLSIAVASVEESLEVGLASFYVLQSFGEVLDGVGKVHEPGMHQSSVEVIKSIVGFQTDCLLELGQSIVDLIEHHHAVSSIGVVLWIFVIEADGCSEVVHGLLVVADSHEGVASVCMVFSVG